MKTLFLALLLLQVSVPNRAPVVDVNRATRAALVSLDPSVTMKIADEIIKGRPYKTFDQLKARIPLEVFEKIQRKVVIGISQGIITIEPFPVETKKEAEAPSDKPNAPQ